MIYWSNFLHFYQPFNQQKDILERIANESYRKLLAGFKKNPKAFLTINMNGGLLKLLAENNYLDIIEDFKSLAQKGQIEFTGSAEYHSFLPLLPEEEIIRQIKLNEETSKKFFGQFFKPSGFFSPELAYSDKLAKIVAKLGYQWIIAEELASPTKENFEKIYSIKNVSNLKILFRDKRISVLILSAIIRSKKSFLEELKDDLEKERYLLTVMDGETFGHHRPGLEKSLFDFYQAKTIKIIKVSDLIKKFSIDQEIEPRSSTWSSEEQDFYLEKEKSHSFTLWQDPANPIHQLQWSFTYFVIDQVKKIKGESSYLEVREKLDKALQSDQYWWASARPWWSLEMIEQGAYSLKEVIFSINKISQEIKNKAENYYRKILDLAFLWQRKGIIRQMYRQYLKTTTKIPFKERAPKDWYNQIILEFEDEMKKAIDSLEFEKAIKWRDAIFKLKERTDIYDVLHVVDDLRSVRQIPSLKSFWEHSKDEFSDFSKKHFERFSEEQFKNQQPKYLLSQLKKSFLNPPKGPWPIGFGKKKDSIFLCEPPSKQIKFYPRGWRNLPCSRAIFKKEGKFQESGQCLWILKNKKIKVIIEAKSFLFKFLKFLEKRIKILRVAICPESNRWKPIYFKEENDKLVARFPYFEKKDGMGFYFKIKNF